MIRRRFATALIAFAAVTSAAVPARAIFHEWEIVEAFTNASGTVQFIELFTTFGSQEFVGGHTITTNSKVFSFGAQHFDTGGESTEDRFLLLATAGFGALAGGVTPDYTLPSNFFNAVSDTIDFGGADTVSISSAPIDGINSLHFTFAGVASTGENSPTNFDGDEGSVNLAPPPPMPTGDYNGNNLVDVLDYVVFRDTRGQAVGSPGDGADGNANGMIDHGDYAYWRTRYGDLIAGSANGAVVSAAIPEPGTFFLALAALGGIAGFRQSRRPGC